MDAQAKKKALYRAKLDAHKQKHEKRIDSPLVRYNEVDQPVCRVCDVILKSESLWNVHQASRKHKEAIDNLKANAAGRTRVNNVQPEPHTDLPRSKSQSSVNNVQLEPSIELLKPRSSSMLPPDFFDNQDTKKQKSEAVKSVDRDSHKKLEGSSQAQRADQFSSGNNIDGLLSDANVVETKVVEFQPDMETSTKVVGSETKQVKGNLPEGFFDNKDADLRARGVKPVKIDVKDEYKEFERLIQEDLQDVDARLEEEEFDAADVNDDLESIEQKAYRERVEEWKKKKMELQAVRSANTSQPPPVKTKDLSSEDKSSSSDDDSDDDFTVDWRAQHL